MYKYLNPLSDFGFKKIFGEEANKVILIDFLNALLSKEETGLIKDLKFDNTERLGSKFEDKNVIFDIYCENERGEKFIVELQKARQNFFIERTIYYSTFPIREQVDKGSKDFNLKAVYCIGILDFTFKDYGDAEEAKQILHEVKLKDQNGRIFYDKLTYIYLELPNFTKSEIELETRLDKWLYFIKHLEDLQSIPIIFSNDVVFGTAFQTAEVARFNDAEYKEYQANLKRYRDWVNVIDTVKMDEKARMAREFRDQGVDLAIIANVTGLTKSEIEKL